MLRIEQSVCHGTRTNKDGSHAWSHMNKTEIIAKTMKDMTPIGMQTEPPFSDEQDEEGFVFSVLQDVLPDGVDIRTCDDFKHPNVECCETCHNFYPHYDMSLIDLPGGWESMGL
jgi:hypothetical protein